MKQSEDRFIDSEWVLVIMKVEETVDVEQVTMIKDSVLLALSELIQVVLTVMIEAEVQAAYVFFYCFFTCYLLSSFWRSFT